MIIFTLIGAFCGIFGARILHNLNIFSLNKIVLLIALLTVVLISIYLQLLLHEVGHLVFGLISGYKFVSFRVGKFMIIRSGDRIKLKTYNIVGTGGQCLMMVPSKEKFPYILYNMGGSLGNILVSLVCLAVYFIFNDNIYISSLAIMNFAISMGFAIINGLPMKINNMPNDGYNVISLGKNKLARECYKLQLQLNGLITRGVRLKDLPAEWFELPEENLDNFLVCDAACLICAYYHDKQDFDKAKELTEYLLKNVSNMPEVRKHELSCELLFYEMIKECRVDEIKKIYDKKLQRYIRQTSNYVSRVRLMYTYELLVNKDEAMAHKQLKKFEKVCGTYPYAGEIRAEQENIKFVDELYKNKIID